MSALVETSLGSVRGFYSESSNTLQFWSLPFAQPPVGELRWRPPLPPLPFASSPYDATNTSFPYCLSFSTEGPSRVAGSEDCLYLTVITPNASSPRPPSGFPVLVYSCGGGFSQCYWLNGESWVGLTQSFIFVSLSYRLGALGFFSVPELSAEQRPLSFSGNQGLQDQTAALRFLRQHIADFGGDPERVTIEGESAGSMSVCHHLLMPDSSGLFQRAIMESGGCDAPIPMGRWTLAEAEQQHRQWVTLRTPCAGLNGSAVMSCLRALPAMDIFNLQQSSPNTQPEGVLQLLGDYVPILDGVIVPDTAQRLFASGRYNRVPLIAGSNAGETNGWLLNAGPDYAYNYSWQQLQVEVDGLSQHDPAIAQFYSQASYAKRYNITDINTAFVDASSAQGFHCPDRRPVRWNARHNVSRSFHYSWNYIAEGDGSGWAWTNRTAHGAEVGLIYNFGLGFTGNDRVFNALIQNLLLRFVISGDVNREEPAIDGLYAAIYGDSPLPHWPAMAADRDESLYFHRSSASPPDFFTRVRGLHADQCDSLWDRAIPQPVVQPRLTQCLYDECHVKESRAANACIDLYNGSYACQCGKGWTPVDDGSDCAQQQQRSQAQLA